VSGLRVLVVDDEREALADLARLLRQSDGVGIVDTATSGSEAMAIVGRHQYDAIFLDVRMPELDGVELARVLRRFAAPPALIFVSAYETAAVEAFELRAVDYLMKPVSRARLAEALERLAAPAAAAPAAPAPDAEAPEADSDVVPVDAVRGGGTRLIPRASIYYLQAYGDYVRIVAADGRFLLRGRLADIERRWQAFGFVRVHRQYLANLRRAVEVRPRLNGTAVLLFPEGNEVPIARRQIGELRRGSAHDAGARRPSPARRDRRRHCARRGLPRAAAASPARAVGARARGLRRARRLMPARALPGAGAAACARARRPRGRGRAARAPVRRLRRARVALPAPGGRAGRRVPGPRAMTLAIIAVGAVAAAAVGIGSFGVRLARTTSDLFVASRAISPWWNAAAISGEYLSAASFLGIAGLVMKFGGAALWLPIGFAGGYLALLLFVAAPLRRFGSYTIPDFAEGRFASRRVRGLAAGVVLLIGSLYLVPQLKGAGLTLGEVVGAPYWVGVVVVALLVALNVGLGGMRGITYVQAFQFWVKVFAISLPACLLIIHLGGLPGRAALFGHELPRAPARGLTVRLDDRQRVVFPRATDYRLDGRPAHAAGGEERTLPAGRLELPAGAVVPVADGTTAQVGRAWSRPVAHSGRASPLFVYSLLIATFLGTMGLPHILVRFYTNPDGSAARRTTVRVLGLLGLFYVFPAVYGALGRVLLAGLYVTGDTDLVVLRLPHAAWPGTGGEILAALVAAGAFAAFMSTASGLVVSIAGTLSYDVWGSLRPATTDRRTAFRVAAPLATVVPLLLAFITRRADISVLVSWAFALAASTFCPMLLLGIWWPRLTAAGAAAGIVVGGATTSTFIALAVATSTNAEASSLLVQPAAVSVPTAFATMIAVSRLRPRSIPATEALMVALHAPEGLGLEPTRARA